MKLNKVAETLRHARRPTAKLLTCSLKPMILMPKRPGGQLWPAGVVLAVGRGEHHGRGPGVLEQHSLEGGQSWRVEMLDHFNHGGRIDWVKALL